MKVNIWIRKEDVSVFNITKGLHVGYWLTEPKNKKGMVQVSITPDEFAFLEDGIEDDEEYRQYEEDYINEIYNKEDEELSKAVDREQEWLINQYNRNREAKDHIESVDEIKNVNKDELDEKIENAKKVINELQDFMKVTGGEFREWFDNLSERAKKIYSNKYGDRK